MFTCMYLIATFGASLLIDGVSESFENGLLVCP